MRLCSLIGVNAGYGPIILNIILHFLTTFTIIFVQIKKYKITINSNFQEGMFYLSSKDDKIDSENINKIKGFNYDKFRKVQQCIL